MTWGLGRIDKEGDGCISSNFMEFHKRNSVGIRNYFALQLQSFSAQVLAGDGPLTHDTC